MFWENPKLLPISLPVFDATVFYQIFQLTWRRPSLDINPCEVLFICVCLNTFFFFPVSQPSGKVYRGMQVIEQIPDTQTTCQKASVSKVWILNPGLEALENPLSQW